MIVNAYGRSNRGDSVLLDECIEEIRRTDPAASIRCSVFEGIEDAQLAYPDVEWSERIGNTRRTGWFGHAQTLLIMMIASVARLPPLQFLQVLLPTAQRKTLREIVSCDVLISAPGGYLHDTNFAYYVALFHLWLGQYKGRVIVLAPQSIGPIENPFSRMLARWVLSHCSAICVRESYSRSFLLEALKMPAQLIFATGDSAFWSDEVSWDAESISNAFNEMGIKAPNQAKILGMTLVNWNFPKSGDPDGDLNRYLDSMAEVSEYFWRNYSLITVVFNQVTEDLPAVAMFCDRCKHPVFVDLKSRDPEMLRALIAKSVLFVGTRFHSCIFALLAERPTFAIAYLPKTSYILKDLDLAARSTPIELVKTDDVISTLESDLSDWSRASSEVKAAVDKYRSSKKRLSDILCELAR